MSKSSTRHSMVGRALASFATMASLAATALLPEALSAQDKTIDPVVTTVVTVDLAARTFSPTPLPFGRRVVLRGTIPERPAGKDAQGKATSAVPAAVIVLRVIPQSPANSAPIVCETWGNEQLSVDVMGQVTPPNYLVKGTDFEFFFTTAGGVDGDNAAQVLPPNTRYDLEFRIGTSNTQTVLPAPNIRTTDLCRDRFSSLYPDATLTDSIVLHQETAGSFEDHFKFDAGVGISDRARYSAAVMDVQFYLLPVDRGADLNDPGLTAFQEFRSRFSVFGGLTVHKLGGRGTVDAPGSIGALVTGVGLRSPFYGYCLLPERTGTKQNLCLSHGRKWLQPMRLNAGWIFLQQQNANPAIDSKKPFHDAFVSLTFDAEIQSILGPFASIFK